MNSNGPLVDVMGSEKTHRPDPLLQEDVDTKPAEVPQQNVEVRAVLRVVRLSVNGEAPSLSTPEHDVVVTKTFYPALPVAQQPNPMLPPRPVPSPSPFPVLILINGYSCSQEVYQWLALRLARAEPQPLVVLTFNWFAPSPSGAIIVNPGVDFRVAKSIAEAYKQGAHCLVLPALLAHLRTLNTEEGGVLQGRLDLDRLILGGHSLGGWLALSTATLDTHAAFPLIKGAFSFGSHTCLYPEGSARPRCESLKTGKPLMLMGGTRDGMLALGASNFGGDWDSPCVPFEMSFEALAGGTGNHYLVLIEGANHYLIANPVDETSVGLAFDWPAQGSQERQRETLARAIELFLGTEVLGIQSLIEDLHSWLSSLPADVATFKRK